MIPRHNNRDERKPHAGGTWRMRRSSALLGLLLGSAYAPAALANTPCTLISGTMYRCTGDQGSGITFPGAAPLGANSLEVQDLTGDVPKIAVTLPDGWKEYFWLSFTDAAHKIWNDATAPAIGIDMQALSQTYAAVTSPPTLMSLFLNGTVSVFGGDNRPAVRILGTGARGTGGSGDGGKGGPGRFGRDIKLTFGANGSGKASFVSTYSASTITTPLIDLEATGGSGGPGANASGTGGGADRVPMAARSRSRSMRTGS